MDVGVDVGMRRLAVCCPESGLVDTIDLGKKVNPRRDLELHVLQAWAGRVIPPGSRVWCEAQFQMPGLGTTGIKLAMTAAVVLASAVEHGGTGTLVPPASWKAAVVGHGGADKARVRAWLLEHHPALAAACGEDQDLTDAACLGFYGRSVVAGLVPPGKLPRRRSRHVLRPGPAAADEPPRGRTGKRTVPIVPGPA